jgi:DNA polymerase-3 subunit gamma/tau
VTRLKVVKEAALGDTSRTEAEKTRGVAHANAIGMAHLSRAWSMLLKGIREVDLHPNALMAAEMILIRLAHAAELPGGEELAKRVLEAPAPERFSPTAAVEVLRRSEPAPVESSGPLAIKPIAAPPPQSARVPPAGLASFKDILALAAEKRDIKLKSDLERYVRPIRVSPGQFELALEPGAHPGLANEIARKLEAFTGTRWMVLVAKEGGEKPIAAQAKESRDSLFRAASEHPDVQAVLRKFPGAEIIEVRAPEAPSPAAMSEDDEESR